MKETLFLQLNRRGLQLRDSLKQHFSMLDINVSDEDLAYLEVQMQFINQTAVPLEKFRLNDVVPVMMFRAEEEAD